MKIVENSILNEINPGDKKFQNLKIVLKILFGFVIIAVLFFVAINISQQKLSQLSYTIAAIQEPNIKLIKLKEVSNCLYSAEGNVKAYIIRQDTSYLHSYEYNIDCINKGLDTLQLLSAKGKISDGEMAKKNKNFPCKLIH